MNIPKRNGHYELKVGQNTIIIDIETGSERMSRLDKIQAGDRSRIGGYKSVTIYHAKVVDANGNVIDALPNYYSTDESKYVDFISSFVGKENGVSINPNKLLEDLELKFQRETGMYVMNGKFNGIVKNKIKFTFYVDDWHVKRGGSYDPSEISAYFEKLGAVCKIADKKKQVRAGVCWVAAIYLPLDFSLNESKNMKKNTIRLTESDLHKIIRESVKRALREGYHDKVSDEDDEKDDFFDPDGNPPRLSRPGKKRNKNVRLPLEMEGRRSRRALTERRLEDSYPEVYNDPNYKDDSYPERYDEFYNAEDPIYTAHKGDYNGILSMLQQYGITDATIEDEDPEGEYPPTLSFTVPPNNQEASEEIEDLVCSRGWRLMFVDPDEDNGGEIWTFGYEKDDYFDDDAYTDEYNDTTDRDLDADVYENTIRRAVRESLNRLIETDCAGVMQTGCGNAPKGTNPEAGQYTVPLGGDEETSDRHPGFSVDGKAKWNKKGSNTSVMRRPMYNPKSGKKK